MVTTRPMLRRISAQVRGEASKPVPAERPARTRPASPVATPPPPAIERSARLRAYRETGFEAIQGWCQPQTLSLLAELAEIQDDAGVTGGSCEIGVYHGKLFIALHLLRSPGTRSLAIDLFENQELNIDHSGVERTGEFVRSLQAHCPEPDAVDPMARDSLDLSDADVLAILQKYERFRLLSVDGGHTADHAVNDLRLAQRVLAAGGIVALDDYYNQDWPGVHEGVARLFILDSPRIFPFLIGFGKLYFTTIGHHDRYLRAMVTRLKEPGNTAKLVHMYGHQVLSVRGLAPQAATG